MLRFPPLLRASLWIVAVVALTCWGRPGPQKVGALERAFFANHVTADVLFATGEGIAP